MYWPSPVECERPRVWIVKSRGVALLCLINPRLIRAFEMTPRAPRPPRWTVALLLICQTVRLIEGHPSGSSDAPSSISKLIEEAYDNAELLRPQQWLQLTDADREIGLTEESDTTKEASSGGMMQYMKRKLLQVSSSDTSMHRGPDEKIVFPDGRTSSTSPQTSALPSICRKSAYCEHVPDYPRQLVTAAIARNASLRFLESVDPMPDIEQRIDVADETSLCRYREQVIFPQTAQNKEKQWLFIVNQDDLKQGIRIEICLNDGQECSLIDGFAEGYKSVCKQKYIYRELAAVASDGKIVKDQFRFPSSCCCHLKFIGDHSVRLGLGPDLSGNRTEHK